MIAVLFALPEESQDLVRALKHRARVGSAELAAVRGTLGAHEIVVAHTGVGRKRADAGMRRLWAEHHPDQVISAGFAGGLDPRLPKGALLLADSFSSPELLYTAQSLLKERASSGMMATCDDVLETPQAKTEFARQSGAEAVDMETAAVAAFCMETGVPLLAIRAISDTASDELPVPFSVWFDEASQRPRPLALVWFLVRHPSRIPRFVRFVQTINRARRILTGALLELLSGLQEASSTELSISDKL
ncbi:MAG: hypothetical protein WCP06_12400 [Verrucomicrobiota bacterium]